MLLKRNILLVLMLIPLVNLPAQNFTLKSYTTADGLAHNNIRTIVRDSSGFLWIGTWDGLSRFDGHEFKNYFHEPDDTASIPYFSINDIRVDRCNNLWIFTDTREVVKYNRGTDDFKVISSFDSIMPDKILGISIDKKGNLILISKSYIIIQDPLKNKTRVNAK